MKDFTKLRFRPEECRRQLDKFRRLLESDGSLDERKDILPFFTSLLQLSAFLSSFNHEIVTVDRIAMVGDDSGWSPPSIRDVGESLTPHRS